MGLRGRGRFFDITLGVTVGLMLLTASAAAHHVRHAKTFRVGVLPGQLLLNVTYEVDPGETAVQMRARFDLDANGRIDTGERAQLLGFLIERATHALVLLVDDVPVSLERIEADPHGLSASVTSGGGLGLTALLAAHLPLNPTVRIELRVGGLSSTVIPVTLDLGSDVHLESVSPSAHLQDVGQEHGVELKAREPLRIQVRFPRRST